MIFKYLILLYFFVFPLAGQGQGLGRLFLTPEQRVQLDVARVKRDQRPLAISDAAPTSAPIMRPGPGTVTYNGAVQRSDGKSTVWINGKPIHERDRLSNDAQVSVLGLRRDGAVSVTLPQGQRTASLKAGQKFEAASGRIEEAYAHPALLPKAAEAARDMPVAAAITPAPSVRTRRTLRESDFRESDPDSGATTAERRARK